MSDLLQLDDWMQAFIARLDGSARQELAKRVAVGLRKLQAQNIKSQRGADGAAWAKRKRLRPAAPPIRYYYRARDGHERELEMSNYRNDGKKITGYDKEAKGMRSMLKAGMLRKLQAKGGVSAASTRRAQLMLQRMAMPRNLRARATSEGAELSFSERADRIARVHHFGERDRVNRGGPEYDYPARSLLGIGDRERSTVLHMVEQHLSI